MEKLRNLAELTKYPTPREKVGLDQKIIDSAFLLQENFARGSVTVAEDLDKDSFRIGIVPRLSPYDVPNLMGTEFVEIPTELKDKLKTERSYDLIRWNLPERFLFRLNLGKQPFEPPVPGDSIVMNRLKTDREVVSFENLKIDSPPPKNGRQSRSKVIQEINIMGQARIPFALGSVPDIGSFLSYTTMAMAGGLTFISRDKLLSDHSEQAKLTGEVINYLKTVNLPKELRPTSEQLTEFAQTIGTKAKNTEYLQGKYYDALRDSWIANVGAAIETDSEKYMDRVDELYKAGCRLFRIYSPEGGTEIVETAKKLREKYKDEIKIVGGQIMDYETAARAEEAGCDAIIIGVAGGSQCTTSVNANIPVKTPNLLYDLRGTIGIPIGIEGGGVGTNINVAFVLGASFLLKAGEIGASLEGSGGKYLFQSGSSPEGNLRYWMPYGGEASVSAKWWKDSSDDIGRPTFVEGETGVRELTPERMSMTGNIRRLRDMLSIGLVFQRAESIPELHKRNCSNIVKVTPEAGLLSQPYAK